jgi:hypothetical protein
MSGQPSASRSVITAGMANGAVNLDSRVGTNVAAARPDLRGVQLSAIARFGFLEDVTRTTPPADSRR